MWLHGEVSVECLGEGRAARIVHDGDDKERRLSGRIGIIGAPRVATLWAAAWLAIRSRMDERGRVVFVEQRQHRPWVPDWQGGIIAANRHEVRGARAMGRTIGILGGMGPLATADFYRKIILATPARCDQEHLRVVIEADPTIPDRSAFLRGQGSDPLPALTRGAQRLMDAGADFIAIPCNTAHAFLPALRGSVALPFLDIVVETAVRVRLDYPAVRRVGILATESTIATGLYHAALCEQGLEPLQPDAVGQALVSVVIAAIKGGDTGPEVREQLLMVGMGLIAAGAEVVLAACTELPIVLLPGMLPVPLLDPTTILAEAAVRAGRASGE